MKITDIKATTVTVPLEAPLRHANGCHWGRFVRTIVEVETDEGMIGLGEMGGGGESAEAAFRALKTYLVGHDPARLEEMRFRISNPTASLYNNRTQMLAALEFACLDILGQKWGVPVYDILGGRLRDTRPLCFLLVLPLSRTRIPAKAKSAQPAQLVRAGRRQQNAASASPPTNSKAASSRRTTSWNATAPSPLRSPATASASIPTASGPPSRPSASARPSRACATTTWRTPSSASTACGASAKWCACRWPPTPSSSTSSNWPPTSLDTAVDVILLDTTFWGGIRQCVKAAAVCETFQLGVAVHSSGELGIQLATMLHLGAVLPNLSFAADAHYHHLTDDIIEGGRMPYENGAIRVPSGPGLGVRLNRDKLAEYAELYKSLGGYPYDQDPLRPGWAPTIPNNRWADPADARVPQISLVSASP